VVDASNLLTDAAAGTLPAVSWYLPKETEHPPRTACAGENATVKAVDAIMRGPQWRSTAVVVWWTGGVASTTTCRHRRPTVPMAASPG
jgi:phospholipase C